MSYDANVWAPAGTKEESGAWRAGWQGRSARGGGHPLKPFFRSGETRMKQKRSLRLEAGGASPHSRRISRSLEHRRAAMTPARVQLVQDSFKKVAPIAHVAADLFYDRLFVLAPEVRSLF